MARDGRKMLGGVVRKEGGRGVEGVSAERARPPPPHGMR